MDIGRFFSEYDAMFANGEQTDKIEQFLKNSLSCAECEGDLASAVSVCNEMGGFYRVNGAFSKGEDVLNKALQYINDIDMTGTPGHATTLLNLATLLTHKGDISQAAAYFESASEILERSGSTQSYAAAALHNNIASLYLRTGDYSKGLAHTHKALSLLEGAPDKGDERGVTYTIAAQIMLNTDDLAAAEKQLDLARLEFASDSQSSPLHRATMEHCLAELLIKQEKYDEAGESCERGIALLESCAVRSPALDVLRQRKVFCENASLK